jgi:Zn-dependent peptidase ImmA (M78 family)
MKRGFKAHCDRIVTQVRKSLGLARYDPFDPFAYAELLGIACQPVSTLPGCPDETLAFVAGEGRMDFSAVTVYEGERALVVYNDNNNPERQRSDLSHELSHVTLEHEPRPVFGDGGCRAWDKEQEEQEEEAAWLSGVLLVPADVALAIARKNTSTDEAAHFYGVSVEMMRYRLNASGAYVRVRNEARGA